MTTTELIAFLKKYEFGGATGRPREVYICLDGKFYDTEIKSFTTGDGLITELYIDLGEAERMRRKIDLIAVYAIIFGAALVAVGVVCTVIPQIANLTWKEILAAVGAFMILIGIGVIWFDN